MSTPRKRRPPRVRTAGFPVLCLAGLALGLLGGCTSQRAAETRRAAVPTAVTASQTQVNAALSDDPALEALIAPYRAEFEATMGAVLATCPRQMRTDRPEGLLGALVADIMLARARSETALPVHASMTNNGGLRTRWEQGPITLGLVYELMPFDNEIVVLRFSGAQIRDLANELAAAGGEPVSGLKFVIRSDAADEIEIGGARPDPATDYWVATNDYLAGGGGHIETLWQPRETRHTGVLIRDAIADALRESSEVPMPQMGRIRQAR